MNFSDLFYLVQDEAFSNFGSFIELTILMIVCVAIAGKGDKMK